MKRKAIAQNAKEQKEKRRLQRERFDPSSATTKTKGKTKIIIDINAITDKHHDPSTFTQGPVPSSAITKEYVLFSVSYQNMYACMLCTMENNGINLMFLFSLEKKGN